MIFENIPNEMRVFNNWCAWRYEETEGGKPTKVPYSPVTGRLASSTNPETWTSFETAAEIITKHGWYDGLGFVLTERDPYVFIDLDDPFAVKADGQPRFPNPNEILARQLEIYNCCVSYAERSPSGKGLHIIAKGNVPAGRNRSGIEVYSNLRFMTMTGNVFRPEPIAECNEYINALWHRMDDAKSSSVFYAGLAEAKLTDEEVMSMAATAINSEKFHDLFVVGDWQKYYPSQSEADFALFDILAFYSENGAQTQRLFLQSALGQRDKSRAQYRINYMLARCFDRMLPPVNLEGMQEQWQEAILKKQQAEAMAPAKLPPPKAFAEPQAKPKEIGNSKISVPPGLVGDIAQFIYQQAPRPVAEIALAGAIGFLAGIVGRAYNISGTGLNQYVLLLAPTGTGKESIASGIDKMMNSIKLAVPASMDFVGPGKINSEQALINYLNKTAVSFSSVVGEFGIKIKEMSSPFAPPHMANLLALLLDLFNKSGEGKFLQPSIYSDRAKNTAPVQAPAVSIIGESTPEKFYESLDETMISSGMLPRFFIVEYHGDRPPLNKAHQSAQPSFSLVEKLSTICAHSLMLNSQHKAIHVQMEAEAAMLLDDFNVRCDAHINGSDREVRRHLWNRAHIKALKLAALVAVGCNPYNPVIDKQVAVWVMDLTLMDVKNLLKRFDAGEIGADNDETKQLAKCMGVIKDYCILPWSNVEKYVGPTMAHLHSEKVIPFAYVQRRLASVAVFKKDRQGATAAIKRALKTLIERGDLQEVARAKMMKDFNCVALSYIAPSPKVFGF